MADPAPRPARARLSWPASTLASRPHRAREWLVPDRIPAKCVTLLGGDGGVGKSQVALQLAVAVVTGAPFLGLPIKRGPAIYLSAEDDDDELKRRLIPACAEAGVTLDDVSDLNCIALAGEDALLAVPKSRSSAVRATALFAELANDVREIDPALIVIDTLADVFGGHELDRGQARSFMTTLRGLCRGGASVLLLAHPSIAGMTQNRAASGSTAFVNSARAALHLRAEDGLRRLLVTKSNYGPSSKASGLDLTLRWRDGAFAVAAPGDVPRKFRHQAEKNKDQADAKVRRLSEALPADLTVETILPVLEAQCFLDRADPKNHRRTARYWIEKVEGYRSRKSVGKGDADAT
ncbi:MAG: AAA family ATPase [Roseovarius sp.]|uniref:AAA family ATPase n=1 Tax=Roseovarius sp. TaxID=1486281 RepID=UPI0040595E25